MYYIKFLGDEVLSTYNTNPIFNENSTQRDLRRHGPCQVCNNNDLFIYSEINKRYMQIGLLTGIVVLIYSENRGSKEL